MKTSFTYKYRGTSYSGICDGHRNRDSIIQHLVMDKHLNKSEIRVIGWKHE